MRAKFTEVRSRRGEKSLLDVAESQILFARMVNRFLLDVEFDDDAVATRWIPAAGKKRIILNLASSFGQPIVKKEGVPTAILANAARSRNLNVSSPIGTALTWLLFRAAVAFEKDLAA